jgi:hypothetical protein
MVIIQPATVCEKASGDYPSPEPNNRAYSASARRTSLRIVSFSRRIQDNNRQASCAASGAGSALLNGFDGRCLKSISFGFTAFRMLEIEIAGERAGIFDCKMPRSLCLMSKFFQPPRR